MNIVAIGGGERQEAFRTALEISGNEKTSVLIIPTACSTEVSYNRKVNLTIDRFKQLGVRDLSVLHKYNTHPTKDQIVHELGRASLIYTIGGNTPHMLTELQAFQGTVPLKETIKNGTIHVGTSAGALLPFELAHSNPVSKPTEQEWDFKFLPTLGLIPGVATVHANKHDPIPGGQRPDNRFEALVNNFPENIHIGYAIDNDASLVFTDGKPSSIKESANSKVQRITRQSDNSLVIEEL